MADVFAGQPCSDEDVARESPADYTLLAPKFERLAEGSDGAIGASSWDLASATNDFAAQGVQPGHVVVLETKSSSGSATLGRKVYGVSSAATACTLRLLGYAAGVGRSPGAPSGLSAIRFSVPSVLSYIQAEAVDVRRMLGIAAAVDLSTLPDLRRVAALKTLRTLYFAEYRQTAQDTWKDKMGVLDMEIAAEFASLRDAFPSADPTGSRPEVGFLTLGIAGRCWPPVCSDDL